MKKILYLCLLTTTLVWSKFHLDVTANQNDNEYLLENNDIVFSGDKLKFSFSSEDIGKLKIFSTDRNTSLYNNELQKNRTYYFPEDGQELKLDHNTGIEKFTFFFNDKIVKTFTLNHINKQVSKKSVSKQKDTNRRSKKTIVDFPVFDEREYTDLSKVISNTRSATDKKVFKELSSPTVIIKAGQELGAGVVIDTKGLLLTNWHIVQDQPYTHIAFKPRIGNKPNKNNYYVSKVIKVDPQKDLALLQLLNSEVVSDKNIKPITFADMKKVEVGEDIYTIGHPVGYYYSLTNGIIGNILNDHSWEAKGTRHKADYIIKTQNQISGGNSGGPLVNKDLELLGLITYSDTQGQNLNFAVSIEDIKEFLQTDHPDQSTDIKKPLAMNDSKETAFKTKSTKTVTSDITHALDIKGKPIIIQRLDSNNSGKWDIIMVDSNKDGKWDKIGYDKNEDGIIEKWSSF